MNKKILAILVAAAMVFSLIAPLGKTLKAADTGAVSPTSSSGVWTDGARGYSSNDLYATSHANGNTETYYNYGFSLGTSTITKVEIGVEAYVQVNDGFKLRVSWDGGTSWTSWSSTYVPPTSDPDSVTWYDLTAGHSWTATELNDTNFRVQIQHIFLGMLIDWFYLDWIPVRVTYTAAANYTVTYDANGGTGAPTDPSSPYTDGATVTVLGPGSMTRTCYTFSNWNTAADGSGTSYDPTDTFVIHSNVTLYAQWTINTYTLSTGQVGNGSVSKNPSQATYDCGTSVELTPNPDTGWHFVSWSGDVPSGHETDDPLTITMDANKTITATFSDEYTITSSATSGGTISPSGAVIVKQGDNQSFVITANAGYYVKKIVIDGSDFYATGVYTPQSYPYTYTFENVQASHTIHVVFAPGIMHYVISGTGHFGGSISPEGDTLVEQFGSQTFTITPDMNYHFYDVLVDGSSVMAVSNGDGTYSYTFDVVGTNHTIDAYFQHNYFMTTYPLGDETFAPTDTIRVTWDVNGFAGTEGKVRVLFYNGSTWEIVAANLDLADGFFDLDLTGKTIVDPLRCRVRAGIYDPATGNWLTWGTNGQYYDESGHFWVLAPTGFPYFKTTYPEGTEFFLPDDTIHVTWDVEGFIGTEGKVRVLFYNGLTWSIVAQNLDLADGYFDLDLTGMTIVDPLRCRVRAGVYDPGTGNWLTWDVNCQYYDETGHFWVMYQELPLP